MIISGTAKMVVLVFYFLFLFFSFSFNPIKLFLEKSLSLCSFLREESCAKKLAHCDDSCLALLAVRLLGQLGIKWKIKLASARLRHQPPCRYLKHTLQRLQLASHTTE